MTKIKVEVEVAKETYELAKALCDFVGTCKTALNDGWQMGTDLPVAVTAALTVLLPGLQGVENIGNEFAEDKAAAISALGAGFAGLPAYFLNK